jgi:hypothetical protein
MSGTQVNLYPAIFRGAAGLGVARQTELVEGRGLPAGEGTELRHRGEKRGARERGAQRARALGRRALGARKRAGGAASHVISAAAPSAVENFPAARLAGSLGHPAGSTNVKKGFRKSIEQRRD